jgi:hypothetical protein
MITVIAPSFLVSALPFEHVGESDNHFRELFYHSLFQTVYTKHQREDKPLSPGHTSWTFLQEERKRLDGVF